MQNSFEAKSDVRYLFLFIYQLFINHRFSNCLARLLYENYVCTILDVSLHYCNGFCIFLNHICKWSEVRHHYCCCFNDSDRLRSRDKVAHIIMVSLLRWSVIWLPLHCLFGSFYSLASFLLQYSWKNWPYYGRYQMTDSLSGDRFKNKGEDSLTPYDQLTNFHDSPSHLITIILVITLTKSNFCMLK